MYAGSPSSESKFIPFLDTPKAPTSSFTYSHLPWGIATPWPMPVEPSASLLRSILTIISFVLGFNSPAFINKSVSS